MTPDAAGRPERIWVDEPDEYANGRFFYARPDAAGKRIPYVPETELTRLRAEVEALKDAVLAVYVGHHFCRLAKPERGIPAGTPCDVCIECANEMVQRALLAGRKEEG